MTRPRTIPLLLVALLLLSSLAPLASAGEEWEKQTGQAITALATDERGDRIFVGTESGDLFCYGASGNVMWTRNSLHSGAITKILASDDGAYVTTISADDLRMVDGSTGLTTITSYSAPMRDVAAPRDGSLHIRSYGTIDIRDADGSVAIISASAINQIAMDGSGEWFVGGGGSTLTLYTLNIPERSDWLFPGASMLYRVPHSITGSAGAVTDYPVEITVIRGSGTSKGATLYAPQCQADFGDIRFTAADGVTELPYYLKSVDGSTATFLVAIPSLPASPGTTMIYIYWGHSNTLTSNSDPSVQWIFYDDFEDGELNQSLWVVAQIGSGTVVENGGYVDLYKSTSTTDTARLIGPVLSGAPYHIVGNVSFHEVPNAREEVLLLTTNGAGWPIVNTFDSSGGQRFTWGGDIYGAVTMETAQQLEYWWSPGGSITSRYGSDWNVTKAGPVSGATVEFRHSGGSSSAFHIRIYDYGATSWNTANLLPRSWGPVESVIAQQGTKVIDGTITNIDAPETGDWVAVSTTTKTYIIEVTPTGFGTTVDLGARTGTPYDLAIANNGANIIEGRGILADIFRFDGVQVGTYTAGGPVRVVAIAQKNGLYAAAGSDDGKYYIFSKDESSSWYLLHSSDSEDPVTAIAMSWRGEIAIIGRADGSVIAFRVTEEEITGSIRVTVFKDNIPYRDATIYAERSDGNGEFGPPLPYITDSYGAAVIPVQWGSYYRITAGETKTTLAVTPLKTEHVIVIPSELPVRLHLDYSTEYDPATGDIWLRYVDDEVKTNAVTFRLYRTADNAIEYEETFNTIPAEGLITNHTISWTNSSYRVQMSAVRDGQTITNTWHQWVGADVAALPGELDDGIRLGIWFIVILFVAGLFSYLTGPQGAVVTSLFAAFLVLIGWLPLEPAVVALCVVWAFLGLLGRTSAER